MTAIRKHLVDVLAILGADRRRAGRGVGDPRQPAARAAGLGAGARPGLHRDRGRALERAGGHAGPGPDRQRRRRRGRRDLDVRLEDGKAIVTLKLEEDSVPVYQRRERAAAAQDRPEGHGRRAHARHGGGRRARGGRADPDRPDAARRQPRRDPRRARRRHAHLPAAAAVRTAPRACGGNGASWRTRSGASSRLARDSRKIAEQLATRRGTSSAPSTTSRCSSRSSAARTTSSPSSSRTPTRSSPRWPSQDANLRATLQRAAVDARRDATALGKADTLADELGPTLEALRPGARALGPALEQTRPFLRETTPVIKDEIRPFVRAAPAGQGAAPGAARPRRRSRPTCCARFKVVNPLLEHARLQPAGRARGGLPVLGLVGQPPRPGDLLQPGRPRARSAAASSSSAARACSSSRTSCSATRSSACSRSCSRRRPRATSARSRPAPAPEGPADAEGRPQLRPDRRDGGLRAVVLRAAAVPLARVRRPGAAQAEGLPRHASFAEASQLATEADVRISGVPVGKVKTIEPDPQTGPLGRDDRARRQVRAAAVGRARRCCARRRCWARPTWS